MPDLFLLSGKIEEVVMQAMFSGCWQKNDQWHGSCEKKGVMASRCAIAQSRQ
jgi:hypothetical protein